MMSGEKSSVGTMEKTISDRKGCQVSLWLETVLEYTRHNMAPVSLSASLFSVTAHNSGPVCSPDSVFSDQVIASPKTRSAHHQIAPFV